MRAPPISARPRRFAIRVNPDVDARTHPYISTGLHEHKFGVPMREAPELYRQGAASRYLKAAGVSVHIGSQIIDVGPFREAMQRVAALVRALRRRWPRHPLTSMPAAAWASRTPRNSEGNFPARLKSYAAAIHPSAAAVSEFMYYLNLDALSLVQQESYSLA